MCRSYARTVERRVLPISTIRNSLLRSLQSKEGKLELRWKIGGSFFSTNSLPARSTRCGSEKKVTTWRGEILISQTWLDILLRNKWKALLAYKRKDITPKFPQKEKFPLKILIPKEYIAMVRDGAESLILFLQSNPNAISGNLGAPFRNGCGVCRE